MSTKSKRSGFTFENQKILPVTSFDELFARVGRWPEFINGRPPVVAKQAMGRLSTKGYMAVTYVDSPDHYDALRVFPSWALTEACNEHMLLIENDEIFFEIIIYQDQSSRVYAKYGKILGSRIVSGFSPEETRRFFGVLTANIGYQELESET
jgi:hypothetical protein